MRNISAKFKSIPLAALNTFKDTTSFFGFAQSVSVPFINQKTHENQLDFSQIIIKKADMDASSLEFFQKQVASLEKDLQKAQDEMISELETRTQFSKDLKIESIIIENNNNKTSSSASPPYSHKRFNEAAAISSSSNACSSSFSASSSILTWDEKIAAAEKNIDDLTRQLAEARSTCTFIIQRERDKIHLLSSTEDALVSCLCLIVLDSGGAVAVDKDIPQFISELRQWNEARGLTGVLHVFSSWCGLYIEGQKSIVSQILFWLKSKTKSLKILHKNGFPCGSPESEVAMKARKVPNCTLHIEWHIKEMTTVTNKKQAQENDEKENSSNTNDHSNNKKKSQNHLQQKAIVDSMLDTLGKTAAEAIDFAPIPTYLLSQLQDMRHDALNPSRLMSTDTFQWHPSQGRFYLAFACRTRLSGRAATVVSTTLRQRLQRAQGSCVLTPWGVGPLACVAVLQNHPARNVMEEATALPGALNEALRSAMSDDMATTGNSSNNNFNKYQNYQFVCALAWNNSANKMLSSIASDDDDDDCGSEGGNKPNNNNSTRKSEKEHRVENSEEFLLVNSSTASVIGWGVRKLRCMIQFAMENDEQVVFTSSFVDRLTILERQRIRLVARVKFHRCMESDDVFAPPEDGVLSSTAKSVDEQLRNIVNKNKKDQLNDASGDMLATMHKKSQKKADQLAGGRRQGLVTSIHENRGLRDLDGFDVMTQEREKMRKENEERNEIESVFFKLPSLDEESSVLVKDCVHYWMTCDPTGLDSVHYPKVRRLMNATNINHEDPYSRIDLDKFFVVTNRLRHG